MTTITLEAAQVVCCEGDLYEFLRAHGLSGRESIEVGELLSLLGRSTDGWRGRVARYAPDLSADQRVALAMQSNAYWRGEVACRAPGLSADQRFALAVLSDAHGRGEVACHAPDLSANQRFALAMKSDEWWRGVIADCTLIELSAEQRQQLRDEGN